MNPSISRRSFLRAACGAGALGLTSAAYASICATTEDLEVTETTLTYPHLPQDLDGFRIGFLSDLHLGGWVKTELIEEALRLLQNQKVDLLLLGGDYIWVPDTFGGLSFDSFINKSFPGDSDEEVAEKIYSTLAELLQGISFPYGKIAILGNHDRWSSYDSYKRHLPSAGVSVLLNTEIKIKHGSSTVHIIGTEDLWTGIPKLPPATPIDHNEFRLLLTHNPDFASWAYHKMNFPFHLSICGHTHGGQVKLPLIGALSYNIADPRYGEGLVDYGETKFYTTRGIGVVEVPLRVACRPEVTVLTLSVA